MAQATGTTDSYDLIGIAEDVEDIISNISPMDTPAFSMAKRKKVTNTNHQWQTDSLAAAAANRAIEGDDSTYATASPTTMLSNRTQITKKTVMVSGTADAVRKYGRKEVRAGATPLDADAVREFCSGRLSHYKIPRYVLTVEDFPMTVTGKIRKVAMREETAERLGLG
jgi:acyl-CoA synthetase (AMP-forming)/AMP-acid ligase II